MIDPTSMVLTVGIGPLDEYRVRERDGAWLLILPDELEPWPVMFASDLEARTAAVDHLVATLRADLG